MGMVYVGMTVGNPSGGDMVAIPDVLVDTAASHTVLPAQLLAGLHVEPKETVDIELGDGATTVQWGIGQATIGIAGQGATWICPVYFCDKVEFLLGATTLEAFGLMVDPTSNSLVRRVVRARPI